MYGLRLQSQSLKTGWDCSPSPRPVPQNARDFSPSPLTLSLKIAQNRSKLLKSLKKSLKIALGLLLNALLRDSMPIYCQYCSQYLEILCAWLGTEVPVPKDWVGLQSQSQASPSKPQGLQSQSRPGPSDPARTAVPVPLRPAARLDASHSPALGLLSLIHI